MTDTEIILGVGTTLLLSYSEKNRIEDVCLLLLPLHVCSHNLRLMIMLIVHDIQWLFSYLYLMFISKMIFTKRHSTHQIKTHFKLLHG